MLFHAFSTPEGISSFSKSCIRFQHIANKYADSRLTVRTECGEEADGRSIMSLMMLAACYESRLEFKICEIP